MWQTKVALGKVLLLALQFSLVTIIPPILHTSIYMLLLAEGQTYQAWEPSKKKCCFGNRSTEHKITFNFFGL